MAHHIPERDDEGNYILRGVAIWDEHEDSSRPEALRKVDRAALELYTANTNRRIRDTKERIPVACSVHTPKPGETHQPPVPVGKYDNLMVGRIGYETPRAAILADLHVEPKHWDYVSAHQRRSIEVYPATQELDTLILLGSKAPSRDLGPLTTPIHYGRPNSGACVRYEMNGADEETQMPMDDPNAAPAGAGVTLSVESLQALAGLMKSTFTEALTEYMDQAEQPAEPGMEGAEGMDHDVPPELLGDEPPAEPVGAAAGADEHKEEYARHDTAVRYARIEADLAAQKAENAAMKKQLGEFSHRATVAHYEKQIADLQAEGYAIDKAKEMPRLMKLPTDDLRNDAIASLRENGKRVPRTGFTVDYQRPEDPVQYSPNQSPASGEMTPEQAHAARDYAIRNNTNFAAGRAHVMANGKA